MAYRTDLHGDLGWQATLITARLPPSLPLPPSFTRKETPLSLSEASHTPQLSVIVITAVAHERRFDVEGCIVQCTVVMKGGGGQDVTGESRPSRLHGHKSVCSYKSRRSFKAQLIIDWSTATTWQGALPLSLKVVLVLLTASQKNWSDYKLGYTVSVSVPSAIFTR